MEEEFTKVKFELAVPRHSLIELRRKLFIAGVSLQEFVSQIVILSEHNNPKMEEVFQLIAERANSSHEYDEKKKMTVSVIYNAIEMKSPLNESR